MAMVGVRVGRRVSIDTGSQEEGVSGCGLRCADWLSSGLWWKSGVSGDWYIWTSVERVSR